MALSRSCIHDVMNYVHYDIQQTREVQGHGFPRQSGLCITTSITLNLCLSSGIMEKVSSRGMAHREKKEQSKG